MQLLLVCDWIGQECIIQPYSPAPGTRAGAEAYPLSQLPEVVAMARSTLPTEVVVQVTLLAFADRLKRTARDFPFMLSHAVLPVVLYISRSLPT